ncbi:MAG TPA: hypothetical protein PLO51_00315, partial [Candidatus Micrarchaeota archaeon]|nr:hypothetical protein [Candidatus Micrarchaeota archaeon]
MEGEDVPGFEEMETPGFDEAEEPGFDFDDPLKEDAIRPEGFRNSGEYKSFTGWEFSTTPLLLAPTAP